MPGITLTAEFDGDDAPTAEKLDDLLLAHADLVDAFTMDAAFVTLNGDQITKFSSRKDGSTASIDPYTSPRTTKLEDNTFGELQGAFFRGADSGSATPNLQRLNGSSFDPSAAFTVFGVVRGIAGATTNAIWGRQTDASNRVLFQLNAACDTLTFFWGSVSIAVTVTPGDDLAYIASYDGSNIRLWVNGVTYGPTTTAGTSGSGNFYVGGYNSGASLTFDGYMGELWFFDANAFADADLLANIKEYLEDLYPW